MSSQTSSGSGYDFLDTRKDQELMRKMRQRSSLANSNHLRRPVIHNGDPLVKEAPVQWTGKSPWPNDERK
jgi:hypothetical protein